MWKKKYQLKKQEVTKQAHRSGKFPKFKIFKIEYCEPAGFNS